MQEWANTEASKFRMLAAHVVRITYRTLGARFVVFFFQRYAKAFRCVDVMHTGCMYVNLSCVAVGCALQACTLCTEILQASAHPSP